MNTRIKICGITRQEDLRGRRGMRCGTRLDWSSIRRVRATSTRAQAVDLARLVPPFVTIVGLFVNADPVAIRENPCRCSDSSAAVPRRRG